MGYDCGNRNCCGPCVAADPTLSFRGQRSVAGDTADLVLWGHLAAQPAVAFGLFLYGPYTCRNGVSGTVPASASYQNRLDFKGHSPALRGVLSGSACGLFLP